LSALAQEGRDKREDDVYQHPDTNGRVGTRRAGSYGIALTKRIGAKAAVTTVLPAFFTCVFATSIKVSFSSLNSVVQTLDVSILQMTASQ
jgi:hypothetical protein